MLLLCVAWTTAPTTNIIARFMSSFDFKVTLSGDMGSIGATSYHIKLTTERRREKSKAKKEPAVGVSCAHGTRPQSV